MCGGIPFITASVMKILRKSWGTNRSGCPSVPFRPVAVSAASSSLRMAGAVTGRRGPAIATASGIAVGTYVLYGLAASADAIKAIRIFSPWWWLLDRNLLVQDPTFLALGLPLLLTAAVFVYGVAQFDRRDLRFP